MSRRERDKGRRGEREVAAMYESHGLEVRGLEGSGDHLIVCGPHSGIVLHSESKRQETARPWAWWEQASAETEPGAKTVVHFRRSRSPWLALILADELAALVAELERSRGALAHTRDRLTAAELELDELRHMAGLHDDDEA